MFCDEVEGSKEVSTLHKVIAKDKGPAEWSIGLSNGVFTDSAERTVQALVDSHIPGAREQLYGDDQILSVAGEVISK